MWYGVLGYEYIVDRMGNKYNKLNKRVGMGVHYVQK